MKTPEAPASSHVNANAAGIQFSTHPVDGATRVDTPKSRIQTVRCILEFAAEWSRNGLGKKDGSIVLTRENVADIEKNLGAALIDLETAATFVDPAQIDLAVSRVVDELKKFSPFGDKAHEQLALTIPAQSAPAFAKKAGAR